MKNEELIKVLWSISLSENLGDVAEAMEPILDHFKIKVMSLSRLHDELVKRNMMPDYAKEDYIDIH